MSNKFTFMIKFDATIMPVAEFSFVFSDWFVLNQKKNEYTDAFINSPASVIKILLEDFAHKRNQLNDLQKEKAREIKITLGWRHPWLAKKAVRFTETLCFAPEKSSPGATAFNEKDYIDSIAKDYASLLDRSIKSFSKRLADQCSYASSDQFKM